MTQEDVMLAADTALDLDVSRSGASLVLHNRAPLPPVWDSSCQALAHWAALAPHGVALAERDEGGAWRMLTYHELEQATRIAARRLLRLGCSPERPLAIVADNSIDHAVLALAAQRIGSPVVPISVAYAAVATAFDRLDAMIALVSPVAIFFGNVVRCERAVVHVARTSLVIVPPGNASPGTIAFDSIELASEAELTAAAAHVGPDMIARLMFTSGSTGKPKAVINTQRMLCSNQAMLQAVYPVVTRSPPVLVDWLPWSHTFGANFTFNLALFNGGALYIDEGKPVPALIETTLANMQAIQPTICFNVPAGYEAIVHALRDNKARAAEIFERVDFAFCAAAALPQNVREELSQLVAQATGRSLPIYAGWGSTETAPCSTATWWSTSRADNIGLPLPGVEVKLVPDGNKFELRVRGPNVMPGYWQAPDANAVAFDADGFYRMGDAGRLIDDGYPEYGIVFDGRVSENFKLTSGTWVNAGAVRVGVVNEARPVGQDVVVTGSNRNEVGVLVFANFAACRKLVGSGQTISDEALATHPLVIEAVRNAITRYNGEGRGSSARVARFLILPDTPSIDKFEITDKGYLNQRATLENRIEQVERLYNQREFSL